jgi:hypothetical protein
MNDAQKTALVSSLLSGALGILLTTTIGFLIRRATLARRREEWLQSGQVGLASAMIGDQRIEQLGNSILEFLAPYLGAVAGALFVSGREDFRRASTYGVPKTANIPTQFKRREGLLGQAAVENRPVHIGEVPEGYLAFGSALGQDKPKHLVIFPGSIDGNVNPPTLQEVGEKFGISRERVRQIESRLKRRLKDFLSTEAADIEETG